MDMIKQTTAIWTVALLVVLAVETDALLQIGLSKAFEGKGQQLFSTTIGSEPAGVSTIFVDKRKRVKGAAKSIASAMRRRRRNSHDESFPAMESCHHETEHVALPLWACHSTEELNRLAEMKYLLKDDMARVAEKLISIDGVTFTNVIEAFPDVYSDFRMLRFLRKDKLQNASSAAARFRDFLTWREDHDIDQLRIQVEKTPSVPPEALQIVNKFIPCHFSWDQIPLSDAVPMILHVGDWDTSGIAAEIESGSLSMSDFLLYWAFMFESLTKKLHEDSMKCESMLYIDQICDLTTLNLHQFSPLFVTSVMKPWLTMTQKNFPETTKRIFFLRPPRIIAFVWNLVKPLVSPGTLKKVEMHRKFKGSCENFVSSEVTQQ